MTSEFNEYVKNRARRLGRSEASVRSKLRQIGVKASDSPRVRDVKIAFYVEKLKSTKRKMGR